MGNASSNHEVRPSCHRWAQICNLICRTTELVLRPTSFVLDLTHHSQAPIGVTSFDTDFVVRNAHHLKRPAHRTNSSQDVQLPPLCVFAKWGIIDRCRPRYSSHSGGPLYSMRTAPFCIAIDSREDLYSDVDGACLRPDEHLQVPAKCLRALPTQIVQKDVCAQRNDPQGSLSCQSLRPSSRLLVPAPPAWMKSGLLRLELTKVWLQQAVARAMLPMARLTLATPSTPLRAFNCDVQNLSGRQISRSIATQEARSRSPVTFEYCNSSSV